MPKGNRQTPDYVRKSTDEGTRLGLHHNSKVNTPSFNAKLKGIVGAKEQEQSRNRAKAKGAPRRGQMKRMGGNFSVR